MVCEREEELEQKVDENDCNRTKSGTKAEDFLWTQQNADVEGVVRRGMEEIRRSSGEHCGGGRSFGEGNVLERKNSGIG